MNCFSSYVNYRVRVIIGQREAIMGKRKFEIGDRVIGNEKKASFADRIRNGYRLYSRILSISGAL